MGVPTSLIRRSLGHTVGAVVGGLVASCATAMLIALLWKHPVAAATSVFPLAAAVILFWKAVAGSGIAPCPACGIRIDGLSTVSNDGVLCNGCKKYLESREGYLRVTFENRVADTPLFGVTLPELFRLPQVCCVCAKPAAQLEPLSVKALDSKDSRRVTADVPHCAEHHGGAALVPRGKRAQIRFRSYPYFRAFCELNKLSPE
jgi:hypothetical protein